MSVHFLRGFPLNSTSIELCNIHNFSPATQLKTLLLALMSHNFSCASLIKAFFFIRNLDAEGTREGMGGERDTGMNPLIATRESELRDVGGMQGKQRPLSCIAVGEKGVASV